MKWFRNFVKKVVLECIENYADILKKNSTQLHFLSEDLTNVSRETEKNIKKFETDFTKKNDEIGRRIEIIENEITHNQRETDIDITNIKQSLEIDLKRINLKIGERMQILSDDLDSSFTGLTKHLDKKLELLGDKKGIVVGLLKRIAELEGKDNVSV